MRYIIPYSFSQQNEFIRCIIQKKKGKKNKRNEKKQKGKGGEK